MALESMMAATKRMRPPQSGHCSTSISRPRRMSSAQVRLHGPATFREALEAGPSGVFERVPKPTTSPRHLAFGASTP